MVEIREQSATGTVIGTTTIANFNQTKSTSKTFDIPIEPTAAKADLFVVFKNENDQERYVMNADKLVLEY